jgi:thioredoxin-like negative regulator of GroEL
MKFRIFSGSCWLHRLLLSLFFLLSGFAPTASAAMPGLPDELKKNTQGQMVLVDFFSPMCGACMMMEPHLKKLESKTMGKVVVKRVDITQARNEKYAKNFKVLSTPVFMLFDASGKPVYRMEGTIAPSVLEKQVLRSTRQLKSIAFPKGIPLPVAPGESAMPFQDLILVSLEKADCKPCKSMAPYLNGFELSGQEGLHVLHLDANTQDGKALMEELNIKSIPAYVLFDNHVDNQGAVETEAVSEANQRGELFRVEGSIKPRALWDIIRLFGQAGV